MHAGGRVVGTTGEHPFWVEGAGWVKAQDLRIGDVLLSHDGARVPVEGVADSGRYEAVYNVSVEADQTYFVGGEGWGWSVWAHNKCTPLQQLEQNEHNARRSLRRSMQAGQSADDAHHIIPHDLFDRMPILRRAATGGWEANRANNGIMLDPFIHHGPHIGYSQFVERALLRLQQKSAGLTDAKVAEEVQIIADRLRNIIQFRYVNRSVRLP